MAFRLPHGLKDPAPKKPCCPETNGAGPGVVLDGFDHGGAFADALFVCAVASRAAATMEAPAAARSS